MMPFGFISDIYVMSIFNISHLNQASHWHYSCVRFQSLSPSDVDTLRALYISYSTHCFSVPKQMKGTNPKEVKSDFANGRFKFLLCIPNTLNSAVVFQLPVAFFCSFSMKDSHLCRNDTKMCKTIRNLHPITVTYQHTCR